MLPDPLHPAVVHFPIVLAILAPVVAAGALWAIRRGADVRRAWGIAVLSLGALLVSAWAATQTGEQQEDRVERVVSEGAIHTHEEAAELFLFATLGVVAVAAVGLAGGGIGRAARVAGAAGTLALVGLGANVGRSGGELVYRHGAASAYTSGAPAREAAGEGERRRESDDEAARRQVGEAQAHFARIVPLLRNLHNDAAGAEMAAAAEHLGSAVRLAGGSEAPALRDIRATAARLAVQPAGVPSSTAEALATLAAELDRTSARLAAPRPPRRA
jgi:uncharacterized membrane protein